MRLYLKGERFTSLYYTELGGHTHPLSLDTLPSNASHSHKLQDQPIQTEQSGEHSHKVTADIDENETLTGNAFEIANAVSEPEKKNKVLTGGDGSDLGGFVNMRVLTSKHQHEISLSGVSTTTDKAVHYHGITGATENFGVSIPARTSSSAYTFINDLRVSIDGTDYTNVILQQLGWAKIGDGSSTHEFVNGTEMKEIQLKLVGADLGPGEHVIELSVASGGGRVRYNLYVE